MKKLTTALVFLLSTFMLQSAYAQLKIGYTNPARILSEMPAVQDVDEQINALIEEKDQELAQRATELQQMFSDYEAGMGSLSQNERATREEELMNLNQQFETDREQMMRDIQQRRNELMSPLIEQMNEAMDEVAQEMDLDLILNEGTSYGDAIIFFADEEQNVTDEIINKLNN